MRGFLFVLLFTLPTVLSAQKHKLGLSVSAGVSNQTSTGYMENINNSLPTTTPNQPPKFLNPPVKEEYAFAAKVYFLCFAFNVVLNTAKSTIRIAFAKGLINTRLYKVS
jgi:nickel-dependent lactate racemase